MENIAINVINEFGYLGICILIAIENIFPPIPSELILTFGGSLTTVSSMSAWGVIIAATIGSTIGASVLYLIGRSLNSDQLVSSSDFRIGNIMLLQKEDVGRAKEWFDKCGNRAVFYCRFVPVMRSLISIPAGMAKMRLMPFMSLTVLGTSFWNIALVYLGRWAGDTWRRTASYIGLYSLMVVTLLILTGLTAVYLAVRNRHKKQR